MIKLRGYLEVAAMLILVSLCLFTCWFVGHSVLIQDFLQEIMWFPQMLLGSLLVWYVMLCFFNFNMNDWPQIALR